MSPPISDAEKIHRLRLIRSDNVGPLTFYALLDRFGSADRALEALPDLALRGGSRRRIRLCSVARAEAEFDALTEMGGTFLFHDQPGYPALLAKIEDAPPVLAVLGHPHILEQTCVAVVGTRAASAAGRAMAEQLARELSRDKCIIVSGMARGIDSAAHRAALEGGTCAVLAGGADFVYPPENAELYEEIKLTGCIVSEMPLGFSPQGRHFPRRNRISSGLSLATLVVEAPRRSGAMITARLALEQGRIVGAVPGSPADPRSHGVNLLLSQGAVLVQNAADLMREIAPLIDRPVREIPPPLMPAAERPAPEISSDMRAKVLESLGPVSTTVDEVIQQTGLSTAVVQNIILELNLAGRVQFEIGQRVSLAPA